MNIKEFVNLVVENMYSNQELTCVKDGDAVIVWNAKRWNSVLQPIDVPEITKTAEKLLAKYSSDATDIKEFETFCINLALICAGFNVSRGDQLDYMLPLFYSTTEMILEDNEQEVITNYYCKNDCQVVAECYAKLTATDKSPELEGDPVNHPKHYETDGIECIDAMLITQGVESVKGFCVCNAFKYLWRHNNKNNDEDIKKAAWYLNKYVDILDKGSKDVTDSCGCKCSNCTNCKGDKTK